MKFEDWVIKNHILQEKKNFSKGWWDYIDLIRKIKEKTKAKISVFAEYEIMTPPPSEFLKLPLIKLSYTDVDIYIREDFSNGGFFDSWLLSVSSKLELFGLEKHINDIKTKSEIEDLGFRNTFYPKLVKDFKDSNILFEKYKDNKKRFTFTVEDEYDLLTIINIIYKR